MEYIKTAHSVYYLQYHAVWDCRYHRRILNPGMCGYIRKILPKLLQIMPSVKLETIGFDKDYLHMVISIQPKYSIAAVMGQLKANCRLDLAKGLLDCPKCI
jgi:putative transposase